MDYLNTNAYDCDIDMMSQPYDESGYQHANEDMMICPGRKVIRGITKVSLHEILTGHA